MLSPLLGKLLSERTRRFFRSASAALLNGINRKLKSAFTFKAMEQSVISKLSHMRDSKDRGGWHSGVTKSRQIMFTARNQCI